MLFGDRAHQQHQRTAAQHNTRSEHLDSSNLRNCGAFSETIEVIHERRLPFVHTGGMVMRH